MLGYVYGSNINQKNSVTKPKKLIESIYETHDISGYGSSEAIRKMIERKGGNATYGEITFEGAKQLLSNLKLTKNDVFYDLGSGVGKLCMQVALTTPATAVGIELCPERSAGARKAKKILKEDYGITLGTRLQFMKQNLLDASLEKDAVIFMNSLCFSEKFMAKILKKIKSVPGKKRVFSTKEFAGITPVKTYRLPMSWAKADVYMYEIN